MRPTAPGMGPAALTEGPPEVSAFVRAGFATYVIDNVERGRAGFCSTPGEWPGQPIQRTLQEAWTVFRFGPR